MSDQQLTPNAVADIKTEFELEREKIMIERARIDLERERLSAERERWKSEAEWRSRASGRMIPVSTLVYVSVICVLAAGMTGWLGGNLVARRERQDDSDRIIKAITASSLPVEGAGTNAVSSAVGHRAILLFVE